MRRPFYSMADIEAKARRRAQGKKPAVTSTIALEMSKLQRRPLQPIRNGFDHMERSMFRHSYSYMMRVSASSAIGDGFSLITSWNLRRTCAMNAASMIWLP